MLVAAKSVWREGCQEIGLTSFVAQETHVSKLKANLDSTGDASLQNAIQLAVDSLTTVPPYGHREVRSVPQGADTHVLPFAVLSMHE